MADKFDRLVEIGVAKAQPDEQAEARVFFGVLADIGRSVETVSADLDRIATALDLARDWVRESNLTPTHCIVFLARANEDGSDGIKFFSTGGYRSHAQTGMVFEGLDMMRSTGTYYQGD